jgi:hypothetical protein
LFVIRVTYFDKEPVETLHPAYAGFRVTVNVVSFALLEDRPFASPFLCVIPSLCSRTGLSECAKGAGAKNLNAIGLPVRLFAPLRVTKKDVSPSLRSKIGPSHAEVILS